MKFSAAFTALLAVLPLLVLDANAASTRGRNRGGNRNKGSGGNGNGGKAAGNSTAVGAAANSTAVNNAGANSTAVNNAGANSTAANNAAGNNNNGDPQSSLSAQFYTLSRIVKQAFIHIFTISSRSEGYRHGFREGWPTSARPGSGPLSHLLKQLHQLLSHRTESSHHQWSADQDRFLQPRYYGCHRRDNEHAVIQVRIAREWSGLCPQYSLHHFNGH
jgi:hypothetical protein